MNPRVRSFLQYFPIALLFCGASGAVAIVRFAAPITRRAIQEAEKKVAVPAPSRFFVAHETGLKAVFFILVGISITSVVLTRLKVRDETDRLLVQGAVFSTVWYVGVMLIGAIIMAAILPHFALTASGR